MELVINDCEDEGCWCGDDHKIQLQTSSMTVLIFNDLLQEFQSKSFDSKVRSSFAMFTLDHHSLASCSPGCRAHVCESEIILYVHFFKLFFNIFKQDLKVKKALPLKVLNCWRGALYSAVTENKHHK